ncbi:MAG: folE [Gammaproteobacteria bacterium]|jgi:GTP cyclohydrolase I|nr:folE [Gammaproteobacteria bacterium]
MEKLYKQIIEAIGENPEREGLLKTPARAASALKELTEGYQQNINDIVNDALFESQCDEMVIVKNIELYSLCEHHMLPFFGKCHVAYIPNGKVIGLSKVARLIDVFARRLQIQENLTHEIANTLMQVLKPKGVAVTIEAEHLCMRMRGVQKQNSVMVTSAMLGSFRESPKTRAEYLALIKNY